MPKNQYMKQQSQPKITAVISFCSNDWRYLKRCIDGVSPFCEEVLITVSDHYFDGTKENYALLEQAFRDHPQCTFLEFNYKEDSSYRIFSPLGPEHVDWRHEWHNTGRWLGFLYAKHSTEHLLFIDCDEIVECQKMQQWLSTAALENYAAYRFAGRWYFREARFVAKQQDDLSLLVNKKKLQSSFLWDEDERSGLFERLDGFKEKGVKSEAGEPMICHYSGVRTKDEMAKKFSTWGHHWERDWQALLEEEFSRPFNGKDFIRGYQYGEVSPAFDPLLEKVPALKPISYEEHQRGLHRFANVIMVSREIAFKKELQHDFAL